MTFIVVLLAILMTWVDSFFAAGLATDFTFHAGLMMMIVLMLEGLEQHAFKFIVIYGIFMDIVYGMVPFGVITLLVVLAWGGMKVMLDLFLGTNKRVRIGLAALVGIIFTVLLNAIVVLIQSITTTTSTSLVSFLGIDGILQGALVDAVLIFVLYGLMRGIRGVFKNVLIIRAE